MAILDTRYIASKVLQQYLVDKDSGFPLSGGKIFFYENGTTNYKPVYELVNGAFVPLPNPITLSPVGTIQNGAGDDVIPYYFPFTSLTDDTILLYSVLVQSAEGVEQFTRDDWPPNAAESATPQPLANFANYIPNGQFLAHNNLNATEGELQAGSTIIAPGGWTFELTDPRVSVNFLEFVDLPWTGNPPQSPPFEVNIRCTVPNAADTIKSLRVKFNDVNKFTSSSPTNYTFGFSGRTNSSTTNVTIKLVKYFGAGGSGFSPITQNIFTLTADQTFFSTLIDFGDNAGLVEGTGQTYVAIDIAFDPNDAVNVSFTDFVLAQGEVTFNNTTAYPVQTNADTLTRSVAGWMDVPDYDGFDLYLPPILTLGGMMFDRSSVGEIGYWYKPVPSPTETIPIPQHNKMPVDGASYPYAGYAANGIPFSRLGQELIANSAVENIPMFGTGVDFVTAYSFAAQDTFIRLTVNSAGTPIDAASDGNTTFEINPSVLYNGADTGSDSLNYNVYSNIADTILAVGNFLFGDELSPAAAGTSGFTLTILNNSTGLLAQQAYAFTLLCTGGSALVNPGGAAKYFLFSSDTTDYYIWFFATDETDPAPGGTGIRMTVNTALTAQDVANSVREIMSAYQQSWIEVTTMPLGGQYWLFSANPDDPTDYYVWYKVGGVGIDPEVGGAIGIQCDLEGTETDAEIATATLIAINKVQYAAPKAEGMFMRFMDPTAIWDKDVAQRWSSISGLSGAHIGTFEFQQILAHGHFNPQNITSDPTAAPAIGSGGSFGSNSAVGVSNNTGGSETRPVNFAAYGFIKY